jgi:hypothetical protein
MATDLHHKGYAVFDFPDEDMNARIERVQHELGPRYGIDFADPHSDKTKGARRIQDAWMDNEDVRAIAANQTVLDLLGKLYGRRAFPFQTLNFPVGTQQAAHSDSVHFSSLPERFMCGVWLAMEDVGADAGPLFIIPDRIAGRSSRTPLSGGAGSTIRWLLRKIPMARRGAHYAKHMTHRKKYFWPVRGRC